MGELVQLNAFRAKSPVMKELARQLAEVGWSSPAKRDDALSVISEVNIPSPDQQLEFALRVADYVLGEIVGVSLVDLGFQHPIAANQYWLRQVIRLGRECQTSKSNAEILGGVADKAILAGRIGIKRDMITAEHGKVMERLDVLVIEAIKQSIDAVAVWASVASTITPIQGEYDLSTRDNALCAFADIIHQILSVMGLLEETQDMPEEMQ